MARARNTSFVARTALALIVALSFTPSTLAYANDSPWQGSTAIVVTGASSGQISVSAPVSLPLALRADGSVLEGASVELRNLSSTPVAVANVRVQERNGAHVVRSSETDALQLSDMLFMGFAVGGSSILEACDCLGNGSAPPDLRQWRAEPGQTLSIAVEGGFENPSAAFTSTYRDAQPVTAAVVVWTVEAV